jgi:glutaconate CoA-transferase subunit B
MDYSNKELQAVMIARQIKNGQTVVVGTGLPLIGASLAKKTYTPHCYLIVESGLMDCRPKEVPSSVADLRFMANAAVLWEQFRYFGFQSNISRYEDIDLISFIGGAQIDPYGNLNSTCIGDYHMPKNRFTGSGGANGIATFFNTIIMMQHQKRRFVDKIDYMTSPGWINGPNGRKEKGLPEDRGPQAVVTDLGIMKFDPETKRMYVAEYYPGVTLEQIIENTGFEIDVSRAVQSEAPEPEVIKVLREEIDPSGVFI